MHPLCSWSSPRSQARPLRPQTQAPPGNALSCRLRLSRSQALPGNAMSCRLRLLLVFVLVPRHRLGMGCLAGSACSSASADVTPCQKRRQSRQDSSVPGRAWDWGRRASKTARFQAEPGSEESRLTRIQQIREPPAPFARYLRRQSHRLIAHRMEEGERPRVQGDPRRERMDRPIPRIAEDRMPMMRQLHPQLMCAARLWPNFQPSQTAVVVLFLIVQQRLTRSLRARFDHLHPAPRLVFQEPVLQRARLAADLALNDGPVHLLDRSLAELLRQSGRRFARPREQQNARNRPVQSMHHAEEHLARLVILLLQVSLYLAIERLLAAVEMS